MAAGMAAAVIGTAGAGIALLAAGMAGVAAGITVATVAVGELAPRSVSVLALDSSEEH